QPIAPQTCLRSSPRRRVLPHRTQPELRHHLQRPKECRAWHERFDPAEQFPNPPHPRDARQELFPKESLLSPEAEVERVLPARLEREPASCSSQCHSSVEEMNRCFERRDGAAR